jgi:hypothetical protein
MARTTRSIKGEIVDFDLIQIKQQIASQPAPLNVKEREAFIDKKVRRRTKKSKVNPAKLDVNVEPEIEEEILLEEDSIDPVEDTIEPSETVEIEEAPQPRKVRKKKS